MVINDFFNYTVSQCAIEQVRSSMKIYIMDRTVIVSVSAQLISKLATY